VSKFSDLSSQQFAIQERMAQDNLVAGVKRNALYATQITIRELLKSMPITEVSDVLFGALKAAGISLEQIEALGGKLNQDAYMEARK